MEYLLPYFEKIDAEQLKERYQAYALLNDLNIRVDLNFKNCTISETEVNLIREFLTRIGSFNNRNRAFIKQDFDDGGEAADHIAFYLDEFEGEELASVIPIHDTTPIPELLLLDALRLIRVGLYPNEVDYFATFDYAVFIDGEPSNQLLVVNTDAQGELAYITWES